MWVLSRSEWSIGSGRNLSLIGTVVSDVYARVGAVSACTIRAWLFSVALYFSFLAEIARYCYAIGTPFLVWR
jgi:hypothetical protein